MPAGVDERIPGGRVQVALPEQQVYFDGVGCPAGGSVRGGSPVQFFAAGSEIGDAVVLEFHGGFW